MRVLIIGGTGVISTGVTDLAIEAGHDVVHYNRGETDTSPSNVETIQGDRTEYERFERQMDDAGPFDCVIDMVCFSPADARSAVRAFDGVTDQYIFCSTVDVYESPPSTYPITEGAPRILNGEGYAPEKVHCERIFDAAHADGAFELTTIRPWYTYENEGGFLHTLGWGTDLFGRLQRGDPVVVHGDGTTMWGATHRDDVARAFVGAIGNERTYGESYHAACERPLTYEQYLRTIAEAIGAPEPSFVHVPTDLLLEVAPEHTTVLDRVLQYSLIYDNRKAKRDLDFEYTISLAEGAKRKWESMSGKPERSDSDDVQDRIIKHWRDVSEGFTAELNSD